MMKQAEHLLFLTLFAHPKNNLPRNGWFNSHYPGITRWEFNIAMEPGTYEQKSPCSISQSAINWQFSTGRTSISFPPIPGARLLGSPSLDWSLRKNIGKVSILFLGIGHKISTTSDSGMGFRFIHLRQAADKSLKMQKSLGTSPGSGREHVRGRKTIEDRSIFCSLPQILARQIEALEQQPLEWDRLEPLNQKDWDNFDFQKPMGCKPHPQLCPGQRKRRLRSSCEGPCGMLFGNFCKVGAKKMMAHNYPDWTMPSKAT